MSKIKKESIQQDELIYSANVSVRKKAEKLSYSEKVNRCAVIAKPMAPKKLSKKIYKLIKKANTLKNYSRNGLKLVQKHLRLGEKGLVFFAGDISPIEIMCHLPAVCGEKDVPYCYIPSSKDIGTALGTEKSYIMVLVKEHDDYKHLYDKVKTAIMHLGYTL